MMGGEIGGEIREETEGRESGMDLMKTYCIHVWNSQTNLKRMNTAGEKTMTICRLLFLPRRNDSRRQSSTTHCRVICSGVLISSQCDDHWGTWQILGHGPDWKSPCLGVKLKFSSWCTAWTDSSHSYVWGGNCNWNPSWGWLVNLSVGHILDYGLIWESLAHCEQGYP